MTLFRPGPQGLMDFAGRWNIRRDILDVDSDWIGRFQGVASFTPHAGALDYFEEGELKFGGLMAYRATRRYFWSEEAPGRIRVDFEDGTLFHTFVLGNRAEASHYCDPDTYDVAYAFGTWPEWRSEWRVEGPKKDYRMVSIYRREAGRG